MHDVIAYLEKWEKKLFPVVCVSVIDAVGSTPREVGAFMLVSDEGQVGTIGGGALEWEFVHQARNFLAAGRTSEVCGFTLGTETGQCCGGHVTMQCDLLDVPYAALLKERLVHVVQAQPVLLMFGAGHVGRALARAIAPLPIRLKWIDPRAEEFGPIPDQVEKCVTSEWELVVANAPSGSAVLVLTPTHSLDAQITAAALKRDDFPYVGLIGSQSKRKRFETRFRKAGVSEERIESLICPIGGSVVRDKRPEIIAALVAAELIERFLKL